MAVYKRFIQEILHSNICKRMGLSLHNIGLLRSMPHPLWAAFKFWRIPTLKIVRNPIREVTREDILLCERLLTSYHKAVRNKSKIEQATASSSWSAWINKYYSKFISVLEERDAEKLAATLASSFRESFVTGLTSGYFFDHSLSRIGAKLWSLCYQDNVIALAEYLGLVRAESREQGEIAYGLKNGLDPIVAKQRMQSGFPWISRTWGRPMELWPITRSSPWSIRNIFMSRYG